MVDLEFYFDPVCPFAWMTSKWVRQVVGQRHYRVDWRFISLRMINEGVDYAAHFPPEYERLHTAGLELLRIAAAARHTEGGDAVGRFYEAISALLFDQAPGKMAELREGTASFVTPILEQLGLSTELAQAADDQSLDQVVRADTEEALAHTGRDVGTPILHFDPPDGTALFGPVISRLPDPDDALALWDHVIALSRFPGFSELKRSLREWPQLQAFARAGGTSGGEQDWEQGRLRGSAGAERT